MFTVKSEKTNVVARIEGNRGRYESWTAFSALNEEGEEVYRCVRPTHEQVTTYFGRESSKTATYVLGLYSIANGERAEGYKKNRDLGGGWFEMSAYAYKRFGNTIVRTTLDVAAAGGRMDKLEPVAKVCRDGKLELLEKKAKVTKGTARTDSGKAHGKDYSPQAAIEKARRG